MSECKRIITPNKICSDSALDMVTTLVVTHGWQLQTACKHVAEEFKREYPEDKANAQSLRRQYQRANTVGGSKNDAHDVRHVAPQEPVESATCRTLLSEPYVSVELYTAAQKRIEELEIRIKGLEESNEMLNTALLKDMGIVIPPKVEDIILSRTEMIETIEIYSTGFQAVVLKKDNIPNSQLFGVVCSIINTQKENSSKHPVTLPKRIVDAIGYEPDELTGTLKSLPQEKKFVRV